MSKGGSNFPQKEEKILEFWEKERIFEKSIEREAPKGDYVFYDGPPFATGLPHYGHIVASILKDVVPRYWTMKGYRVERVWGWDCHGLPIENIVEKEMGSKSKADIEAAGVGEFNESCRTKVLKYVEDWKVVIRRLGRWVNMDDAYKTMDLGYMESIWWVFKQLYDKGLIYEGHRSMHVCPRCETTLSQSEVAEGYRNVKDLSATVKLEIVDEPGTSVLAWTTTPWTLIGNVALAVGKNIDYVKVELVTKDGVPSKHVVNSTGDGQIRRVNVENFILAKDRLEEVFGDYDYNIIDEFKGKKLVGKSYKPLFYYYANDESLENRKNGWQIYAANFVSTEEGTGVVHIAPGFGEDDMQLGVEKNLPFIQHVKLNGDFADEVTDFKGLNVKPADDRMATDVEIIKCLAGKGTLFAKAKYEHSYPHCWRCDTPLLNYATSSMFVAVTKMKDELLKKAKEINWSPEHIKDGRFGKWLEGARDWSISRQRYWASVIPIWCCECGKKKVIGSVTELEELSGTKVTDLHKHVVDEITFPCQCGKTMHRVPDVLDCWFESGSMPYAQMHYPFENKEKFENNFPAEYIAEGADQTRCWFYYLHVLSTGVMNKTAYKNVIVNGIVLAEDGKKMAKKLQNYPDPSLIFDQYGADALRYYLCTSPVMRADTLCFAEREVDEVVKKVLNMVSNVNRFYQQYEGKLELLDEPNSDNVLDAWILARLNELVAETTQGMDNYDLVAAARPVRDFIDDLSTWWLRRSRNRFKTEGFDAQAAVTNLRYVLLELSKVMAPFIPFTAEMIYQDVNGPAESVHLDEWPEVNGQFEAEEVLKNMEEVRRVVSEGLQVREKTGIAVKQALNLMKVSGARDLEDEYLALIAEEVNVKQVLIDPSGDFGVELDTEITPELAREGLAREIVRKVNGMRKEAELTIEDKIELYVFGEDEVMKTLTEHGEAIQSGTIAISLHEEKPSTANATEFKVGDVTVWVGFKH